MAANSSPTQVIYAALVGNPLVAFTKAGAVVSIYHGTLHVRTPEPIHDAFVNDVVLALAFALEGTSWWIALKHFRTMKGTLGYHAAFRGSKDPPSFVGLFEDSAAPEMPPSPG